MKKILLSSVTRIIFILFAICTLITVFIVYKDIKNTIAIGFVIGYAIFTFFVLFYTTFVTILNIRKLKWIQIRKRIIKFIMIFVVFGSLNYIFDYAFRPSKIDLFREFSNSFGISLGLSFFDLIWFKNKRNEIV